MSMQANLYSYQLRNSGLRSIGIVLISWWLLVVAAGRKTFIAVTNFDVLRRLLTQLYMGDVLGDTTSLQNGLFGRRQNCERARSTLTLQCPSAAEKLSNDVGRSTPRSNRSAG